MKERKKSFINYYYPFFLRTFTLLLFSFSNQKTKKTKKNTAFFFPLKWVFIAILDSNYSFCSSFFFM